MDEVTQQNSALVEQNAATAKTLEQQAKAMDERVGFFRLRADAEHEAGAGQEAIAAVARPAAVGRHQLAAAAPKPMPKRQPVAAPRRVAVGGGPVGRMQTDLAKAMQNDADWKEF